MSGEHWVDITYWIYLLIIAVSGYGTLLFLSWSMMNRFRTSSVFAYTMMWIMASGISASISMYGRRFVLSDPVEFVEFSKTLYWPARLFPVLIILIVICAHMTYRIVKWWRSGDRFRNGDRRMTDSQKDVRLVLNRTELHGMIMEYGRAMHDAGADGIEMEEIADEVLTKLESKIEWVRLIH